MKINIIGRRMDVDESLKAWIDKKVVTNRILCGIIDLQEEIPANTV